MKLQQLFPFLLLAVGTLTACNDDDNTEGIVSTIGEDDYQYVGRQVGNFLAEEWYPGGKLGTTINTTASCYEDETPAIEEAGLLNAFKMGEMLFEHDFTETSTASFGGLGPAYVRTSCIDCHPGYGHGKRVMSYNADFRGNGYLLVVYHPTDGLNSDDGPYITEVTGMPQTRATAPFLPPVDEKGIHLTWKNITAMESGLPMTFPDGEAYELIYPELSISIDAFNTSPKPSNIAFRLESTIGLYGTGLLDAIPDDSLKAQYAREAAYVELNPSMWNKEANDWATSAWYTLADGTKKIKRFTYALTRASLQTEALRVVHANEPGVAADFADVKRTVDEALQLVRSSVHALNDNAANLSVQLERIVEGARSDGGPQIELEVLAEHAPANVANCFAAVLREALSNAIRHACAHTVTVRCMEHPSFYQLIVADDGAGGAQASGRNVTGGMGLGSMRERVEALGGTFTAGPRAGAGGWRVFATVPKQQGDEGR